jgi:hypothetical protein
MRMLSITVYPTFRDMPTLMEQLLVERRDGTGPYGAAGAGEGAGNPIDRAGGCPGFLSPAAQRVRRPKNGSHEESHADQR